MNKLMENAANNYVDLCKLFSVILESYQIYLAAQAKQWQNNFKTMQWT